MKYLLIIVASIAFIILVIAIIGYMLPVKHTASVKIALQASPQKVWDQLLDVKHYPEWRSHLKSVEVKSENSWIETDRRNHRLPLTLIRQEPLKEIETKLDGKDLPFGGTWTFTLQEEGNQTLVTITENGEVYNPIFRFVSRYIMGHSATINQYAKDLQGVFNKS